MRKPMKNRTRREQKWFFRNIKGKNPIHRAVKNEEINEKQKPCDWIIHHKKEATRYVIKFLADMTISEIPGIPPNVADYVSIMLADEIITRIENES